MATGYNCMSIYSFLLEQTSLIKIHPEVSGDVITRLYLKFKLKVTVTLTFDLIQSKD